MNNFFFLAILIGYARTFFNGFKMKLYQGRIQDFKLGGAHLKKLRRAEGGAKFLGYFV
jgi:hypothetical protein